MSYHAENGHEFVGLRVRFTGDMQVVYDTLAGKRAILGIKSKATNRGKIDEALREGIASKNVFTGLVNALSSRSIEVEYVD
jgi:hypothetical protein